MPRRFVELDGAGDGGAEQESALLSRGHHDAELATRVTGSQHGRDAWGDGGVAVDRAEMRFVAGFSESRPDVGRHIAGPGDKVVKVTGDGPYCDAVALRIPENNPLAIAVSAAIHRGDVDSLSELLRQHPELAEAYIEGADGLARSLLPSPPTGRETLPTTLPSSARS